MNKKGRRFTRSSDVYAFIYNGYLFIDGYYDLDELYVDVAGYFDDPVLVSILAAQCSCESTDLCKPAFDYELYMPTHIERRTMEIVRAVVFRRLGIPTDIENNDKHDIGNVSNQVQRQSS